MAYKINGQEVVQDNTNIQCGVITATGDVNTTVIRSPSTLDLVTNGSAFVVDINTTRSIVANGQGASQSTILLGGGSTQLETTATGVNIAGTVNATSYTGDGSQLTGVGAADTTGLASIEYVDGKVAISTDGLASIDYVGFATFGLAPFEYVDQSVAGVSTFQVTTTDLAVVNPFNASLTVGQNVQGTNVDHFGIYYGELNGGVGSADLYTTNGNMNIWVDGGGTNNNSIFQFGRDFNSDLWMTLSDQGAVYSGIVTANSFVKSGGTSSQYLMADGSVSTGGGGGGVPSRATLTGTTATVNSAATTLMDINGYKTYALQKITVNAACWVRIYTDPTSRTNDASRQYTEDPQPGIGLIAEVRTETSGTSTFLMSPGVIGWNNNSTSNIYLAVTNNEPTSQAITVDLQAVQMES